MNCPLCNGNTRVTDCILMEEENYRKRKCKDCGKIFFTLEFEAIENEDFKKTWRKHYRGRKNENRNSED